MSRPVSLRNRISLVLVALVGTVAVVSGVLIFRIASRSIEQRLDERLTGLASFGEGFAIARRLGLPTERGPLPLPDAPAPTDPSLLPVRPADVLADYVAVYTADGELILDAFFNPAKDVRPPSAPEGVGSLARGESGMFAAEGTVDGRVTPYRMRATRLAEGELVIAAVPADGLARDLRRLRTIEIITGLVLLAIVAGVSRLLVGLGLRPLQRMEAAAERIAAGDLAQRVEPAGPETEISRLGTGLNRMLERIQTDTEARMRSEEAMRRFVSDASHELRTPLTTISGYAQLLNRPATTIDVPAAAARIGVETERLVSLADSLLALARLDEAAASPHVPVDLTAIAGDVIDAARMAHPERTITLESGRGGGRPGNGRHAGPAESLVARLMSVPAAGANGADTAGPGVRGSSRTTVQGDPEALRRAVSNLVSNACRHTPPGSPIEITIEAANPTEPVVVAVVDHGRGVPIEERTVVFDRFHRGDRSRSRRAHGGAGLGLAIVAATAAAHGGTCTVDDTPGGGATFRLSLPRSGVPIAGGRRPDGIEPSPSNLPEATGDRPRSPEPGYPTPTATEGQAQS